MTGSDHKRPPQTTTTNDHHTSDNVSHVVTWKGLEDCHLLQGRPIRLRFHLKRAKLYSFEPGIRHKHYLQSYD